MAAPRITSRAPRSASVLKSRLIAANRAEFEAGLAWAGSDPSIEAAAARITGARRRFVLGAGIGFTYASLLAGKLNASLAQVTVVDGTIVRPLDILSDVRETDVLIAISLRRFRGYTIDNALPFAQAGGSLVVITDSASNPLIPHCTEAVVIDTDAHRTGSIHPDLAMHPETPGVSPTVVSLVIDLIATLSTASAKGAGRRFAERERLGSELGLYRD